MLILTPLVSWLVVLTITGQALNNAYAYYVPRTSSRLSGCQKKLPSRFSYYLNHDEPPVTQLRFSAADTISAGFENENNHYTGDEEYILKAYDEWRIEYAKGDFDNTCYQNFRANYIKLITANAVELTVARDMGYPDPVSLSLNEYGDVSPEEFNNLQSGQNTPSPPSELPYPESTNECDCPQTAYTSADDQDRIRQIYKEFCFAYEKTYDELRLEIFAINLHVVENYHRETGKTAELNQYADLSPEEYQAIAASAGEAFYTDTDSHLDRMYTYRQTPPSTIHQYFDEAEVERIRQEYLEWCGFHGKEYTDSRLDIFATNLLAVENYRAETGKNAIVNAHADLSTDEYSLMVSSGTEAPPSTGVGSYSSNAETLDNTMYNQDEPVGNSYYTNNNESSYSESLSENSPTIIDQRVCAVYQNWCDYYEKSPSEDGLYHFKKKYTIVENHYMETGEELALYENADLPAGEYPLALDLEGSKEEENRFEPVRIRAEEQMLAEESRLQQEAEDEFKKEEKASLEKVAIERLELARRNEEQRKQAEELVWLENERKRLEEETRRQKEEEERSKFEEAKKRVEEAQLLEQKQAAAAMKAALERRKDETQPSADNKTDLRIADLDSEKRLLQQERIRLEETLASDRVRLDEEKRREEEARRALEKANREIDKIMTQPSADNKTDLRISDLDSEKRRLQQERIRLEETLASDRVRLDEEKRREEEARRALEEANREIDKIMKESEQDVSEKSDPIILPRDSYLGAVAKTWVDRSAYLEALQEGRAGALPNNPKFAEKSPGIQDKQLKIKESESIINSIWNFMKEYNIDEMGRGENYSWNLISQADDLIAETTKKSTGVMGEELRYLKKAVDAMRRRNQDDLAADRARIEAKEWEQIQKGLEKEAKQAKKRREHDERIAKEARQKARSLKSERHQHEKRAEEARKQARLMRDKNRETMNRIRSSEPTFDNNILGQGSPFSFFTNPFQGREDKDVSESPLAKENIFSFFGGRNSDADRNISTSISMTQPVKIEEKESWLDAVFSLFAGEETENEIPGLGTITLEPAKRASVFDLFVSPDSISPEREPGRGSITIDDSQESSIFSFFAQFGISQNKEKFIDPVRRKRVMDYESKLRERQEKLSLLKAGRSRILKEKDKKMSRKEARKLQRELDSLAAGNFTRSARTSGVPQIAKWTRTPDGRITGWISEAAGGQYKMGTKITTSRIKGKVIKPGMTITTISGSQYRMGLAAARSTLDATLNNKKRASAQPSPIGSIFGKLFSGETIPSLVEWTQNEDGTITGFVNNKDGFDDGTQITTSPVEMGASRGTVIQTKLGSKYKLLKEKKKTRYDTSSPS